MSLSRLEELIETGSGPELDNLLNSNLSLAKSRTSHGISPLLLACYYQKPTLIRLILKHLDKVSVFEAAAIGLTEEIEKTARLDPSQLHAISDHGFSPLGIASHFGQEEVARFLLSQHADPNIYSQNGYSVYPLHSAAHHNFTGIAKMLIEAGAEVNVMQNLKNTPLHFAAQNGNIDLIILLLESGANVAFKNENGLTPADLAAEKGFTEIGQILKL